MTWRVAPRYKPNDPDMVTRQVLGEPTFYRNWLAVDLGQSNDYTAMIVGQTYVAHETTFQWSKLTFTEQKVLERRIYSFRIVNAHRPSLGTSYPVIGAQVSAILDDLPDADLIVDATGVGRGVVDILRGRGLYPYAVTITGGEASNTRGTELHVSKIELVSVLIAAAQEDRLHIAPNLALRDVLQEEIAQFTPRRTATGLMTFEGADGAHDDLVMGLAIGVFQQSRQTRSTIEPLRL